MQVRESSSHIGIKACQLSSFYYKSISLLHTSIQKQNNCFQILIIEAAYKSIYTFLSSQIQVFSKKMSKLAVTTISTKKKAATIGYLKKISIQKKNLLFCQQKHSEQSIYIMLNQIKLLGEGGFSKVYQGLLVDQHSNTEIVVKKAKLTQNQWSYNISYYNQLEILKRTQTFKYCPNLLFAYNQTSNSGQKLCLVFQKYEKIQQQLTIVQKIKLFQDIIHCLQKIHNLHSKQVKQLSTEENTIIHRDIKPSNLLLKREQNGNIQTILADFGMSSLCSRPETKNKRSRTGTAFYLSPEMVNSEDYDSRTDCWSFAVTMYEIFCDKKLIPVKNSKTQKLEFMKTLRKKVNDQVGQVLGELPQKKTICYILQRCLMYNKNERLFSSQMKEIWSNFHGYLQQMQKREKNYLKSREMIFRVSMILTELIQQAFHQPSKMKKKLLQKLCNQTRQLLKFIAKKQMKILRTNQKRVILDLLESNVQNTQQVVHNLQMRKQLFDIIRVENIKDLTIYKYCQTIVEGKIFNQHITSRLRQLQSIMQMQSQP